MINKRNSNEVFIGPIKIGGNNPVAIQSMTTTVTKNTIATINQIKRMEEEGLELVRVAVPDKETVQVLKTIKESISIPLIADIHFSSELAMLVLDEPVDKVRINPGNIGTTEEMIRIAQKAMKKDIPLRIGVNAGSLDKNILKKYGKPTPEGIVESALNYIALLDSIGSKNVIISLKSADVSVTVSSYRLLAQKVTHPFHVGVTEAGTFLSGTVKSSIGIGALLLDGIGDTIRVSLTDDPVKEVKVAKEILKSTGVRGFGPEIISCPTCGRCQVNLIVLAEEVEQRLSGIKESIKVAVMGCAVNGPGEAKQADFGIAGGKDSGIIFANGVVIKKVSQEKLVDSLLEEINRSLKT